MSRRNGCKEKVRHASHQAAMIALKRVNNAGLHVYQCPICKGYHLGRDNSQWAMQARITQLLDQTAH